VVLVVLVMSINDDKRSVVIRGGESWTTVGIADRTRGRIEIDIAVQPVAVVVARTRTSRTVESTRKGTRSLIVSIQPPRISRRRRNGTGTSADRRKRTLRITVWLFVALRTTSGNHFMKKRTEPEVGAATLFRLKLKQRKARKTRIADSG
jgi:hypothetical protein